MSKALLRWATASPKSASDGVDERFARRKLTQAYVAMGSGLLIGVWISYSAMQEGNWGFALAAPFMYPYFFGAVFFGWHYGGRFWQSLGSFADQFDGFAGLFASVMFVSLRFWVAVFIGLFGGGILQFVRYWRILEFHKSSQ